MAGLLFVYSRTSIKAAKRNAQLHREADGGQFSLANENLRRHGKLSPPNESNKGTVTELAGQLKEQVMKNENTVKAKKRGDGS